MLTLRKKPVLCFYYVTYKCNAHCVFCDIWRRVDLQHQPNANIENIKTNLYHLKKIGVKFVDFTGGEPLLFRELPSALSHAKKLGLYTTLTTNAILYKNCASSIKGLVDFLHFSLDSTTPQQHNSLRGTTCFHKVISAVEKAKQLDENPDLLFTVTSENYREIKNLASFAKEMKCIVIVNPEFNNDVQALDSDIFQYLDSFRSHKFVYFNRAFTHLRRNKGNQTTSPRCRAVTSCIVISPNNELLLPCFHHSVFAVPINGNLAEAVSSTVRKTELAKQGRHSFCQNCTINCYFDPSFFYHPDKYFFESLYSKLRYGVDKYLRARAEFPKKYLKTSYKPQQTNTKLSKAA